jgi:hypothetical protein
MMAVEVLETVEFVRTHHQDTPVCPVCWCEEPNHNQGCKLVKAKRELEQMEARQNRWDFQVPTLDEVEEIPFP